MFSINSIDLYILNKDFIANTEGWHFTKSVLNILQFLDKWTVNPSFAYLFDKGDLRNIQEAKLAWDKFSCLSSTP